TRGITLRNVFLDMDPVPYTQGRIVAINASNRSIDVSIEAGYESPVTGSFADNTQSDVMLFAAATRDPLPTFSRMQTVTALAGGTYRLAFYNGNLTAAAAIGDFVTIKRHEAGTDLQS